MAMGLRAPIHKRLMIFFLAMIGAVESRLYADNDITIHNHTDIPVYAALYYVKSNLIGVSIGPAERPGDVVQVPGGKSVKLSRPPWKVLTDNREIIYSADKASLKKNLTKKEYKVSSNKAAGLKFGDIYHVVDQDGVVSVVGDSEYVVLKPILEAARSLAGRVSRKLLAIINSTHMRMFKLLSVEGQIFVQMK